jgi:hypothetical protein
MRKHLILFLLLTQCCYCVGDIAFANSGTTTPPNIITIPLQRAPDCDFCKNLNKFLSQNSAESSKRSELVGELFGVLAELQRSRESFVQRGDFTNLFASAYYHITQLEIANILSNKYTYPTTKMEMMLSFYDSYRYNRALGDSGLSKNIEPQWQKYYANAQAFNSTMAQSRVVGLGDAHDLYRLITSGIDAHVQYDLPRAIRNTYQRNVPVSADRNQLYTEFKDTNSLFRSALEQTNRDITQAFSTSQMIIPRDWVIDFSTRVLGSASDVISKREKAYDMAVSSNSLLTGNRPQLTTNRQGLLELGTRALQKLKDDCTPCLCNSQQATTFQVHRPLNTGIRVNRGDRIQFEASGEVSFGRSIGSAGPAGKTAFSYLGFLVPIDQGLSLFPQLAHGCLIARIGGAWVYIGERSEIVATQSGILELNVNDKYPEDNDADFEVTVKVCPSP